MPSRTESDFIGKKKIENTAYYGVQTVRASENFQISGISMSHFPSFIIALAKVKKAAAIANHRLGLLESR